MKKLKIIRILVVMIFLCSLVGTVQAGDWTMLGHDPCHTGYINSNIPNELGLIWKAELPYTGSNIASLPVIKDEKVFTGYAGSLIELESNFFCLDEKSGRILWSFKIEKALDYAYSPCVVDGKVFIPAEDYLYCLDENTGKLIWKSNVGCYGCSSPVVVDTGVYLLSYYIYRLNADNGEIIWKCPLPGRIYQSTLAIDGDKLFVASCEEFVKKGVVCLNAKTSEVIWNYEEDGDRSEVTKVNHRTSTPVVSNGKVVFTSWDGDVCCLDEDDGKIIWKYNMGGIIGAGNEIFMHPCIAYGKVFVPGSDFKLYALDENTGNIVWVHSEPHVSGAWDSIMASNEKVFWGTIAFNQTDGNIIGCFFGVFPNFVQSFNQANSECGWTTHIPQNTGILFPISATIANDKLFFSLKNDPNMLVLCFGKKEPIIEIIDIIETENSLNQEIMGKVLNYDASSLDVHVNGELQKIDLKNGQFDEIIQLKEGRNKIEFAIDENVYKTINISTVKFEIPKETYSFTNSEFTEEHTITYDQFNNLLRSYLVGVSAIKANIITPFVFISTSDGNCYGMSATTILYHEGMKKPVDKDVYEMDMEEAASDIHAFQAGQVDHQLSYFVNYFCEPDEKISYDYIVESIEKGHEPVVLVTWLKVHSGLEDLYDVLSGKYPGHAVVAYKIYELDGKTRVVVCENRWSYPSAGCTNYALFDFSKEHPFKYMEKQLDDENIREVPYSFYPTVSPNTAINMIVDNFLHELTKLLHSNGLKLISVSCPVNVSITDESGRVIADNGTNQIENAKVVSRDDVKLFFLPDDLTYSVNIDAYGEGNFTLTQFSPIGDKRSDATEFNSSVTSKTKASVLISPEKVSEMKI